MTKYTKENLQKAVDESMSIASVIRCFGLKPCGGNYNSFKRRLERFEIDISHFTGIGWNKGNTPNFTHTKKSFTEKVLCKNGKNWKSSAIKEKLFFFGIKEKVCEECGQKSIWNSKPLAFHLEHIDGDHNNNEIGNLKILCPNCHSQTPTYCRKK